MMGEMIVVPLATRPRVMITSNPSLVEETSFSLPSDLTEWIPKTELLRLVRDAVELLDWSNPELVEYLKQHPSYRPKTILCLLVYCYTTGLYDSGEIARACYEDDLLRDLSGDAPPIATSILRFRRENRGLLRWCIGQVLKQAFRTKFEVGDAVLPSGVTRYLEEAATARVDIARHVDRGSL